MVLGLRSPAHLVGMDGASTTKLNRVIGSYSAAPDIGSLPLDYTGCYCQHARYYLGLVAAKGDSSCF